MRRIMLAVAVFLLGALSLLEAVPGYVEAYAESVAAARRGDPAAALTAIAEGIRLCPAGHPNRRVMQLHQADLLMEQGRHAEAQEVLTAILDSGDEDWRVAALAGLARLASLAGDEPSRRSAMSALSREYPSHPLTTALADVSPVGASEFSGVYPAAVAGSAGPDQRTDINHTSEESQDQGRESSEPRADDGVAAAWVDRGVKEEVLVQKEREGPAGTALPRKRSRAEPIPPEASSEAPRKPPLVSGVGVGVWLAEPQGTVKGRGMELDLSEQAGLEGKTLGLGRIEFGLSSRDRLELRMWRGDFSGRLSRPTTFDGNAYGVGASARLEAALPEAIWRRRIFRDADGEFVAQVGMAFPDFRLTLAQDFATGRRVGELRQHFGLPVFGLGWTGGGNHLWRPFFEGRFLSNGTGDGSVRFQEYQFGVLVGRRSVRGRMRPEWEGMLGFRFWRFDGVTGTDEIGLTQSGLIAGLNGTF
jgi:hypothetical protein